MLLINDLLAYGEPHARTIRLLWIHPTQPLGFIIDINAHDAAPELVQLAALQNDLQSERARLLITDPHQIIVEDSSLPDVRKRKRDKAWKVVEILVCDAPEIFYPRHRAVRVAACVADGVSTRATIYLYLRRYWQRGQTPNALLPDYVNSGGRGKKRIANANADVKRGRPRKLGELREALGAPPQVISHCLRIVASQLAANTYAPHPFDRALSQIKSALKELESLQSPS